jgi:hypothetical protein
VKHWELIADKLSKAGWTLAGSQLLTEKVEQSGFADAHRDDGKKFVARSDEKLTAFVKLESAICEAQAICISST